MPPSRARQSPSDPLPPLRDCFFFDSAPSHTATLPTTRRTRSLSTSLLLNPACHQHTTIVTPVSRSTRFSTPARLTSRPRTVLPSSSTGIFKQSHPTASPSTPSPIRTGSFFKTVPNRSRRSSDIPARLSPYLCTPPPSSFALQAIQSYPYPFLPDRNMSLFTQPDYLAAKIDMVFDNDGVVDMIGGANTGSSYSLPGHVVIRLNSLPSALTGRIRTVSRLCLTLEGKSELFDEQGRYSPMRLHKQVIDLASFSKPLLIPSMDPARPNSTRISLAVPFDLRIPGWLPPTHVSEMTNTSYGAVVSGQLGWLDAPLPPDPSTVFKKSLFFNQSLLATATADMSSRFSEFTIRRHRLPPLLGNEVVERPDRNYTLRPDPKSASPVECIVTVPDWVDVNGDEKSLKVSLRLRARQIAPLELDVQVDESEVENEISPQAGGEQDSGPAQQGSIETPTKGKTAQEEEILTHMVELGMEVEETERFSSVAVPAFVSSFPLPDDQPSRSSEEHALISPQPHHGDIRFLGMPNDERPFRGLRTRQCLLADDGNQRNFYFAGDGLPLGNERWRKVNVVLPMSEITKARNEVQVGGRPQAELHGPFLQIKHSLKIRVVCRTLGPNPQDTVVVLTTPIRFGTCPTTIPGVDVDAPATLPAYTQLFHENGELRECEPLPLYSKDPVSLSTPPTTNMSTQTPASTFIPKSSPSDPSPCYSHSLSPAASSSSLGGTYPGSYPSPTRSPSPAVSSSSSSDSMDIDKPTPQAPCRVQLPTSVPMSRTNKVWDQTASTSTTI